MAWFSYFWLLYNTEFQRTIEKLTTYSNDIGEGLGIRYNPLSRVTNTDWRTWEMSLKYVGGKQNVEILVYNLERINSDSFIPQQANQYSCVKSVLGISKLENTPATLLWVFIWVYLWVVIKLGIKVENLYILIHLERTKRNVICYQRFLKIKNKHIPSQNVRKVVFITFFCKSF